jgi:hypothetical protein
MPMSAKLYPHSHDQTHLGHESSKNSCISAISSICSAKPSLSVIAVLLGIDSYTGAWCLAWEEALSSVSFALMLPELGPEDFMVRIMFSSGQEKNLSLE